MGEWNRAFPAQAEFLHVCLWIVVVTDENVFRENLSRRFHYKAFGNRREYCGSLAMNYLKTDAVYNKASMVFIAHKNITSALNHTRYTCLTLFYTAVIHERTIEIQVTHSLCKIVLINQNSQTLVFHVLHCQPHGNYKLLVVVKVTMKLISQCYFSEHVMVLSFGVGVFSFLIGMIIVYLLCWRRKYER